MDTWRCNGKIGNWKKKKLNMYTHCNSSDRMQGKEIRG